MHIMLYDPDIRKDINVILFYINNNTNELYCSRYWSLNRGFFAKLEQDCVFKGMIELPGRTYIPVSSFIDPVFLRIFDLKPVPVLQTVLMTPSTVGLENEAWVKEKLNSYNVSEELDPSFNVYDTIRLINQCEDIDTLKLYELSALPHLHTCTIEAIMQFTDAYNNKLRMLVL